MKTDDLIGMLANGLEPVPRRAATRRLVRALAVGVPLAVLVMITEYGVRRDLVRAMFWPMLWMKIMFSFSIAWGGFVLTQRLARPGARLGRAWLTLVVPIVLVWAMALLRWFGAPEGERMELLLGQTWRSCAFNIALIALPVFVAGMVALKGLAPVQPGWAGAAVGALAGGAGATVYVLHCPESAAPFVAVWYLAGMLIPVLAGALIGPRLLRW